MSEDLSRLSNSEYAKKKAEFLQYRRQVARADRLARQAEFRANAPAPENLSQMSDAEFDKAKQRCLKNIGRY